MTSSSKGHGDRAADILQALWSLEEAATVAEVRERIGPEEVAYNTVQTILNRLVEQGRATREREGRAFVYRPTRKRAVVASEALHGLARRFFGGSSAAIATHLVDELDPDELKRVRQMIDEALEGRSDD